MASRATLALVSLALCAAVVAGSQSNTNSQNQYNSQSTGNYAAIFSPYSPFSLGLAQANSGSNYNYQGQSQTVGQTNVDYGRKLLDQSNSNSQNQQNSQSAGNYAAIFYPYSPFSAGIAQANSGSNWNYQSQGQTVNQGNVFGRKLQGDQSNSNSQNQVNAQQAGNYFSISFPAGILSAAQANSGNNINYQWQSQGVNQGNYNYGRKLLDQSNSNQQNQVNAQQAGNYFSVAVPYGLIAAAQANSGSNYNYQWQSQGVNQGNFNYGRKLLDQSNSNSQNQVNQQQAGNSASISLHFPYSLVLSQANQGSNYNTQTQGQWVWQTNVAGRKLLDQSNSNSQNQVNQQAAGNTASISDNYAIFHFPYSLVLSQANSGSNYNSQSQGQWVHQTNIKG